MPKPAACAQSLLCDLGGVIVSPIALHESSPRMRFAVRTVGWAQTQGRRGVYKRHVWTVILYHVVLKAHTDHKKRGLAIPPAQEKKPAWVSTLWMGSL